MSPAFPRGSRARGGASFRRANFRRKRLDLGILYTTIRGRLWRDWPIFFNFFLHSLKTTDNLTPIFARRPLGITSPETPYCRLAFHNMAPCGTTSSRREPTTLISVLDATAASAGPLLSQTPTSTASYYHRGDPFHRAVTHKALVSPNRTRTRLIVSGVCHARLTFGCSSCRPRS